MAGDNDGNSDKEQAAEKFLERDFNQCFAQMRHYDGRIWDICKFTFTMYTAILAVAIGLYKYSSENTTCAAEKFDPAPVSVAILAVGVLIGLFMLFLIVRIRVYFVVVARYINEHRKFFLETNQCSFPNNTKMYTDPSTPPFRSWRGSHAFLYVIIAVLNGALAATLTFMCITGSERRVYAAVVVFVSSVLVQLVWAFYCLRPRKNTSPKEILWGNKD